MIILQITQLKNFMNTLLRLETFDRFPVSEASITTFTTFSIDGSLHTDFFDPDDAQLLKEKGRTRLLWKDVKSFCYSKSLRWTSRSTASSMRKSASFC